LGEFSNLEAVELKTIIFFIMAVAWFFIKNYENKPRVMPPAPVPDPDQLPDFTGKGLNRSTEILSDRAKTQKNFSTKNPGIRAAEPTHNVSSIQKGGTNQESEKNDSNDQEVNEFAEELASKLRTNSGAREAFIYSEIFNRRV
jgi:hypothetical protein